jgi:predicted metal-dependent peptidase
MSDALQKLARARTALILDHPFFGTLALHLEPKESEKTETMATDGRSLFFNSEFVMGINDAELIGVYAHEVMHPAMQHHTRREGREAERWNEAADYAINPMLVESGFTMPQGMLINSDFNGLAAEAIYERLPSKPPKGEGDGEGGEEPKAPGEVLDAPDPDQDAAEWQVTLKQAAQTAKMMGKLPAGVEQMVKEATAPKIDWKAIMRRFVQQTASADYSWRLPNRRYMAQGIYLPELRSESMPPLVVFLDTSGSTQPFMASFLAELRSVVEECQPECTYLVHVDAAVHKVEKFERGELIGDIVPAGLGGTSFLPAFQWAEDENLQPACAIYLTDGYGAYPDAPPSYPVLWVLSQEYKTPWGENVVIQ